MHARFAKRVQAPVVNFWRRELSALRASALLQQLIVIDITFLSVHVWLWYRGEAIGPLDLNIQSEGSIPELFNYLKWLVSAAACAFAFVRRREPLYLVWAVLFAYLFMDDSQSIHERIGSKVATEFDLMPAFLLRARDFGEIIVSLTVGAVLVGLMALFYWRTGNDSESRNFTQLQLPWLGLLIFFGVIVDMLHSQGKVFDSPVLTLFLGVVEDGGEMIAASILTAISVRQAVVVAQHSPRVSED